MRAYRNNIERSNFHRCSLILKGKIVKVPNGTLRIRNYNLKDLLWALNINIKKISISGSKSFFNRFQKENKKLQIAIQNNLRLRIIGKKLKPGSRKLLSRRKAKFLSILVPINN